MKATFKCPVPGCMHTIKRDSTLNDIPLRSKNNGSGGVDILYTKLTNRLMESGNNEMQQHINNAHSELTSEQQQNYRNQINLNVS